MSMYQRYDNGKWQESTEVDRHYSLGESVFTTLRWELDHFIFLPDHLERLRCSASFLWPTLWQEQHLEELSEEISRLGKRLTGERYIVRIDLFVKCLNRRLRLDKGRIEYSFFISEREQENGVAKLVTVKRKGAFLPSFVKTSNYLEAVVALNRCPRDCDILFVTEDSRVLECSTSNIFFKKDGITYTPALETGILEGITRRHLINCLREQGDRVEEQKILFSDIMHAQDIWLTNSVRGIVSVEQIEDHIFLKSGEIDRICDLFATYCQGYRNGRD